MRRATLTSLAVLLLTAPTAFAQDEVARKMAVEVASRVAIEKATSGAPYSADTLVEGVQVLADGNRIVRKTTGRVYRDSEGRTRREEDQIATVKNPATGLVATKPRTTISIVDPVGGFSYSLDPENKIAWKTAIGVSAAIAGKVEAVQVERKREIEKMIERKVGSADEQSRTAAEEEKAKAAAAGGRGGALPAAGGEVRMRGNLTAYAIAPTPGPLEHRMLDGIAVEGRKTTTTIPAGQVGNEQPLTVTSEEWRSPDLGVLVMTRYSDPRTGDSTYRLTNIVRAEPDRSLFMVPPDYTVRESGIKRMLESSLRKD